MERAPATGPADLIVTNATAVTLDPRRPQAEAVATRGERICHVGTEADALELRGPGTTVIDAQGRTLLPGIIDGHFHLMWGSLRLGDIQLAGVRGREALARTVQGYARAHPEKTWLRGQGLSYDLLPDDRRLTRHDLDEIEARRPLVLTCFDYHTVWCNTAALERAGILGGAHLAAPAEVVVGEDGLASGELREFEAMRLVYDLIPEPTEAEVLALLREGVRLAAAAGITSVHNMNGNSAEFDLYRRLEAAGELTLRVYLPFSMDPRMPLGAIDEAVALRDGHRSTHLRAGALKLFMDGVAESFTAFLLEPYANADGCGEALFSAEHFDAIAVRADRAGLQLAVHAIGDAAVRRTLDGFEAARRANGARDSRHRIEHIELLHPDDRGRFAELGVVASMQPYHCTRPETGYLPSWLRFIPATRYGDSFPWQTLRAAGARLCFGSDWPVVSMNPFLGVDAAVNRQPWAPGLPPQAQTLAATLAAYTCDAAYAEFMEGDKGRLGEGMLADLVLLSADVFELPPGDLAAVKATLTVCGGRIVHRA